MASFLDKAVSTNQVVMFSANFCPYCVRAKNILAPLCSDFVVYNVDEIPQGNAVSEAIYQRYQHETVPAIFINQEFIGGCSDLEVIKRSGKLQEMLDKKRA